MGSVAANLNGTFAKGGNGAILHTMAMVFPAFRIVAKAEAGTPNWIDRLAGRTAATIRGSSPESTPMPPAGTIVVAPVPGLVRATLPLCTEVIVVPVLPTWV